MSQSSVTTSFTVGLAGQLADLHAMKNGDVLSKVSEESSAEIPFGVMLQKGTADGSCKLLSATTNSLIGVSVHSHAYAPNHEVGDTGVKPKVCLGVLNVGRIYVTVEDDVTPASEVHVRAVATGDEVKGAFCDADGTDTIDVSAFCRYLTSASAGGLALLEVDMRNANLAVADT